MPLRAEPRRYYSLRGVKLIELVALPSYEGALRTLASIVLLTSSIYIVYGLSAATDLLPNKFRLVSEMGSPFYSENEGKFLTLYSKMSVLIFR